MEQPESNAAAERASGSLQRVVRPLYDSADFHQFCELKKQWMPRRFWKNLQAMWEEELMFRYELESALWGEDEALAAWRQRPNAKLTDAGTKTL